MDETYDDDSSTLQDITGVVTALGGAVAGVISANNTTTNTANTNTTASTAGFNASHSTLSTNSLVLYLIGGLAILLVIMVVLKKV